MENRNDSRMERLEMEFAAIDGAIAEMRYLGYSPKNDSWRSHCAAFGRKLADQMQNRR